MPKLSPFTWVLLAVGLTASLAVGLPAMAYFLRASADAVDPPDDRERLSRSWQEQRQKNHRRTHEQAP